MGSTSKAFEQSRFVRITADWIGSSRIEKDRVGLSMSARFGMASSSMELDQRCVSKIESMQQGDLVI